MKNPMFNPLKRMEKPHLEQTLINPTRKFAVSGFACAAASSQINAQALLVKCCCWQHHAG
ncbi:hypothetical protein Pvag_0460 [Pantoea vagans C9-1]|jgi:hypothetical protein|nr:hypothetical protein Pvag_0460 [Pantoea vagans C9-1]